jgi:hypothetical protein
MDDKALYLRVGVMDAHAYNVQTGSTIWDGDAIQVSLDPVAAPSPALGDDADMLPAGALFAAFAQTKQGPQAWAHLRGGNKPAGPLNVPLVIERDEALGQTLYKVVIPFTELGITAGLFPQLGFGLQVNDANPNQAQAAHLSWGGGPSGTFRPSRLHRLAHAPLPPDYLTLGMTRTSLWQDYDFGEAILVSRLPGPLEVEVRWRQQRHKLSLPADESDPKLSMARRWRLRVFGPPACGQAQNLQVTVSDANGRVREHLTSQIACPARRMDAVRNLLQTRLAAPKINPLEQRMRQTQAALLDQAWARAQTLLPESPEAQHEVLDAAEVIARASLSHAAEWNVYATGQKPLTLSFVASQDNSLQPYGLRLPKHWTPDKPQPLVVFLHGKGDPRMTQFISDLESRKGEALDNAYVLLPWGRGIMGYQGLAEADVLEAMASAAQLFAFDVERTYLAGFSMGGAGAWSLALHHPEPWAAVAIASGGTWLTSLGVGLGRNAQALPIGVWHGDADGTVDVKEAHLMQEEMRSAKGDLTLHIIKGGGHAFGDSLHQTTTAWLFKHKRSPLGDFTYVADDFAHRDRRGVRLRRETALMPYPSFSVRTSGDTVHIDSTGTTGLDVDLGPKGLNRAGATHVIWNNVPLYHGPPAQIVLGTGSGR